MCVRRILPSPFPEPFLLRSLRQNPHTIPSFHSILCHNMLYHSPPPFPELGTNAPLLRLSRACPSAKLLIVRNFAQLIQPRSSASSSRSGKLPNLVRIGRHQFFWALSTNFGTKKGKLTKRVSITQHLFSSLGFDTDFRNTNCQIWSESEDILFLWVWH